MTNALVGPSLGWIFDTVPDTLLNILEFVCARGANAVELCLSLERLRHLVLFWNQELADSLKRFSRVSIHLPDVNWRVGDLLTREVITFAGGLRSQVSAFVVHPDAVEDWTYLDQCNDNLFNRKISVEFPMDIDKKSGRTLPELEKIRNDFPNLGYVLDVQHAYENDPTGKLAAEAAKIMGERLWHLHVSGQKQRPDGLSRHAFLYEADNREAITEVLRLPSLSGITRISEGEFKTCDSAAVISELNCLRQQ